MCRPVPLNPAKYSTFQHEQTPLSRTDSRWGCSVLLLGEKNAERATFGTLYQLRRCYSKLHETGSKRQYSIERNRKKS